ncbi:MAG: bifunctional (p)ppGpp synthetase/guanosine-3',5'-bis(diphosphate) 3'-pyrophosphohydrolase [Nonomuraea sp.]|nr:bifunctional (p)ppGpp synthetase/guanosine-3',5'-bis(diphosphate) 3'-pyrophosphohydrolase [Nonomuraea sp.]
MKIFTSWLSWGQAAGPLAEALPSHTVETLREAVRFARRQHGVQQRPTGRPYAEHLLEALEVAVVGAEVRDRDVLTAIVLHDVLEDTPCTEQELRRRFGADVTGLVKWVTRPAGGRKADHLAALAKAPPQAVLVKLADRVSNVQQLQRMPWRFQKRYFLETVAYILPLAEPYPWFAAWYEEWRRPWERRVARYPG